MTRKGKIARLPKQIRDQLNRRLSDGGRADQLAEWLNGLEPVKAVLKSQFGGRPISEQNMSAWRLGGYVEWEQAQGVSTLARELRDDPEKMQAGLNGKRASECFSTLLAVKLAELSQMLLDKKTNPQEQWKRFRRVHEQLSRLRRDEHRSASRRFPT